MVTSLNDSMIWGAQMANKLGLPLNQKTLKGYILAEIQAALLQTTGKTSS
jgi:hypothetical protein